jgi:hypothetical protein
MAYRHTAISSFPRAVLATTVFSLTILPMAELFTVFTLQLLPLQLLGNYFGQNMGNKAKQTIHGE